MESMLVRWGHRITAPSPYHRQGKLAERSLLCEGWCPSGPAGSGVHSGAAYPATGWPPLPLGSTLALDERERDDE